MNYTCIVQGDNYQEAVQRLRHSMGYNDGNEQLAFMLINNDRVEFQGIIYTKQSINNIITINVLNQQILLGF